MTESSHVGEGIAFPLRLTVQGNLQLSPGDRNLEESIQIILRTQPGERVYRPDFGCRLAELTFAPMNTQTLLMVRLYIREALEQWEPRIVIDDIRTEPDPMQGRVDVTITYHPKESHDRRSLVYPFYLLPPG
ncbi:GPW/gp25 family protein [Pantanalinema sp. GBBB05]|uniref:GPW/gp25 family protein n=1 Tax=Pantanalinema sp. GBBB05 TaxID=2604139 RepID=UPI003D8191D8